MSSLYKIFTTTIFCLLISACATNGNDVSKWPAKHFYDEAQESLRIGDFVTAIQHLEDLEIHHPFSPYTQQGQLEIGFAYYKYDEPDSALAAADRYIKLYPRADNVDYAYYLKGLVNFDRSISDLDIFLDLDPAERNPAHARAAFNNFAELIRHYPNSKYSEDARKRMVYLRNNLAKHELHAADYYLRRGAYMAVVNRSKYVLEHYPQTPSNADALVLMIKAYRALNSHDLADDALRVFKLNYPNHPQLETLIDEANPAEREGE